MELVFVKAFLSLIISFSNFTDCAPLMLKQTSLCFMNTFLLLKHFE